MISKLVVWGPTRQEAIARMRRALDEYLIAGIHTTIPFHRWLMDDEDFLAGRLDTDFIARRFSGRLTEPQPLLRDAALIAAALDHAHTTPQPSAATSANGDRGRITAWKLAGRMDLLRRRG
jgi:acetyl-CoA carboxylase biotin carboxylase subunit